MEAKKTAKTTAGITGRGALLVGATAVEAPVFGAEITLRVLQGTLNTCGLGFLVAGDGVGFCADKVKGVRQYLEAKHKQADGRLADWYGGAQKKCEAPAPPTVEERTALAEAEVESLKQEAAVETAAEAAPEPAKKAKKKGAAGTYCEYCGRTIQRKAEDHIAACKAKYTQALEEAKGRAAADPEADLKEIVIKATGPKGADVRREKGMKKFMDAKILAELAPKEDPAPAVVVPAAEPAKEGVPGSVLAPNPA